MPTKLTFFGGVNEIGGNKILLDDRGTRIFLDFGKSFGARAKYYDWTDKPRTANGIGDLLSLGLVPDISGIYRPDLLALAGRKKKEDLLVHGLVLSHAHADHADYISFLREEIELYMGETTKRIIEAIEEDKKSTIEYEITSYKERPAERNDSKVQRKITTFNTEQVKKKKIVIDSIEVEPIHVDHSIPGCYGFIIRTSSKTIVYTGDLRIHGNNSSLTRDFVDRAAAEKVDVLLTEGTRIGQTDKTTENDVFETCKYFVGEAKEVLIYADYSYKDIDRFSTFYKVAKNSGRKLLIPIKAARYLAALATMQGNPLKLPFLDDENILIYKPRVKSGSYKDLDYAKEDRELYNLKNVWTAEDVKNRPSEVIATLGSYNIEQLLDIAPSSGLYLHSSSEPFNEEGEMSEAKMDNWIKRFGLERIHAHCSGHASGRDLNEIVKTINPGKIVPIHTENPSLFKLLQGSKVSVPELAREMEL